MDLLLHRRSVGEPELMDDPACDPVALDNTYRLFGVINPCLLYTSDAADDIL